MARWWYRYRRSFEALKRTIRMDLSPSRNNLEGAFGLIPKKRAFLRKRCVGDDVSRTLNPLAPSGCIERNLEPSRLVTFEPSHDSGKEEKGCKMPDTDQVTSMRARHSRFRFPPVWSMPSKQMPKVETSDGHITGLSQAIKHMCSVSKDGCCRL